jgi:hypothetical protein
MNGPLPPRGHGTTARTLLIFLLTLQITFITAFHKPIVEIELPALPADYDSLGLPLVKPQVRDF